MGTSVGLWCVEHSAGYWESGVRHDEAMAWVWRNRQLLLAAGALLDDPGPGWEVIGQNGSPLQHGLEQFLRTHQECTVRHYNEYGDIGDVVLEDLPPCGALHPQLQGTTADGAVIAEVVCQLPEGHSWQFHHWRKADLNGSVERTWRRQPVQTCTGLAAAWCPVHGDCTCPVYGLGVDVDPEERHLDAPTCPLHSPTSTHPEEP